MYYRPLSRYFSALILSAAALIACSDQQDTVLMPSFSEGIVQAELASPAWQARARALVMGNSIDPATAVRMYTLVSVAQYGAVVDANEHVNAAVISPANEAGFGAGGRSHYEAERGAVAGASAQVLSFLFPAAQTALEDQVIADGNAGPGGVHPLFTRGVELGRAMGDVMIARAQNDRFTQPWTGTIPTGPGLWIANGPPALPQVPNVMPYFLSSSAQFHPPAPPAFGSAEFLAALAEIKDLSLNRTAEQLELARSLNLSRGTITSLGFWNQLAAQYIAEMGWNERAATHVFALSNAATMDALIGCWEAKYSYWYIRPSQATTGITLPIGLPNHPSYPSGHSCNSGAATAVLAYFFPQHAAELNDMLVQAGLSRMYGGIHYRFDVTAGQNLGRAVAQNAINYDEAFGLLSAVR